MVVVVVVVVVGGYWVAELVAEVAELPSSIGADSYLECARREQRRRFY